MKRIFFAALCIAANPAMAMKVTNLDQVPHKVLYEGAGTKQVRLLAPGETTRFVTEPNGFLSLISAETVRPSRGRYHADGLLTNIVGEERNQGLPADSWDEFVIWPEGRLGIQGRKKAQRGSH